MNSILLKVIRGFGVLLVISPNLVPLPPTKIIILFTLFKSVIYNSSYTQLISPKF